MKPIRYLIACLVSVALLAGCGGGGGSAGSTSSSASSSASSSSSDNVLAVTVEAGSFDGVNIPFASVTVCAPGGGDCQTVDHVLIDTGSTGLRLFASVLSQPLAQDFTQQSSGKSATGECMQFSDGYTWGPIRQADVHIAGKSLSGLAVQIIGDANFPSAPSDCDATGPAMNTAQSFGANGVLGVSMFLQDCGSACVQSASAGLYYTCAASACQPVVMPLAQQVQNPASLFGADNNGVMLSLPTVPPNGAVSVAGSLVFGIGTQANNAIGGSATVLATDPDTGYFTTVYNGRTLINSFIDSGSNGLFFPDATLPTCEQQFYCPATTQTASASNLGTNGIASTVSFNVANADTLVTGNLAAFNDLAGTNPTSRSFDWGLPFFFGRSVFTAFEGRSTPRGAGPYFAY